MVATDFEIKFAQSRIDYFDKVLKKGENDKVKTLLKAIKVENDKTKVDADFSASGIAKAIKTAKEVTQEQITAAKATAKKATADANAMKVSDAVTQADIDAAKNAAKKATADADAMKVGDAVTQAEIDTAKAAAKKATADAAAMKVSAAMTQNEIDTAKATAKKATADAAAMKVGDADAVTVAAKALLGDDTVKAIKATSEDSAAEKLYVDKAPEFLKDYGFINAIAKNIPNVKSTDSVLKANDSTFAGPADTVTEANVKVLNAYAKIVATVCGTGPFVKAADLPEKDSDSHQVENCLKEANKVAFPILSIDSCGKDKLQDSKVDDACYKGLADKDADLYITTDFDKMHTDLSGEYPYDKVFSELDAIAV
jgi:hypothetical protein